jgi:hypothetical protein
MCRAYTKPGFLRFSETDWKAFEEVVYEPQDFLANGPCVVVPINRAGEARERARHRGAYCQRLEAKTREVRRTAHLLPIEEALEAAGPPA